MDRALAPLLALVLVTACVPEDPSSSSGALVVTNACEISGLGTLAGGDFLAGRVRGTDTGASGSWLHDGGSVVLGDASWIFCHINGEVLGDFGGPATIDDVEGYRFQVSVEDRGDPSGGLVAGAAEVQTVSATRTYSPSRWEDGSVSIEGRAIVTIPSELPVTVGNAGNQWTWLRFQRSESSDVVVCRYRGGASTPLPSTPDELAAGSLYSLERCTGEAEGTPSVGAGDRVDVRWMTLHVQSGAHALPAGGCRTTVSVDFEVTPLFESEPPRDFYTISVSDASGAEVLYRTGFLLAGDLRVALTD